MFDFESVTGLFSETVVTTEKQSTKYGNTTKTCINSQEPTAVLDNISYRTTHQINRTGLLSSLSEDISPAIPDIVSACHIIQRSRVSSRDLMIKMHLTSSIRDRNDLGGLGGRDLREHGQRTIEKVML